MLIPKPEVIQTPPEADSGEIPHGSRKAGKCGHQEGIWGVEEPASREQTIRMLSLRPGQGAWLHTLLGRRLLSIPVYKTHFFLLDLGHRHTFLAGSAAAEAVPFLYITGS